MNVLDLRPRGVRLLSSWWGGGTVRRGEEAYPAAAVNLMGRVAGRVADRILARRVRGRRTAATGPQVISVGNLALGGTGKTPVTGALAVDLADAGLKGAILTRGFGSSLAGPLTVRPDDILAGDEARLLAQALDLADWPVIQARRRAGGLDYLKSHHPDLDLVILEDGHQTASVGRDLDIVILDRWQVVPDGRQGRIAPVTGPVVPFGPWRESARGAERAGIWLLETAAPGPSVGSGGQMVARFQRRLTLAGPSRPEAEGPIGGRAALLSGIARPAGFEAAVGDLLTEPPVLAVRCGDHAEYGPRVVARITAAVRSAGADFLVTTAKDWVKLEPFLPADLEVLVTDLAIVWEDDKALPALVRERLAEGGRR